MQFYTNISACLIAFVAPVDLCTGEIDKYYCLTPYIDEGQCELFAARKLYRGSIDDCRLHDGWWYWQAASHDSNQLESGVFLMSAGQVSRRLNSVDDLLISTCFDLYGELPLLEGKAKDIVAGRRKRAKFLIELWGGSSIKENERLMKAIQLLPLSANWWSNCQSSDEVFDLVMGTMVRGNP